MAALRLRLEQAQATLEDVLMRLREADLDELRGALRSFKASADNLRLYPPGHALVEQALADAVRALVDDRLFAEAVLATEVSGFGMRTDMSDTLVIDDDRVCRRRILALLSGFCECTMAREST